MNLGWKKRTCVCERDRETDCIVCVFELVNHYAIILWSPGVLPVDAITSAELSAVTRTRVHTHTHTTVTTVLSLVSVSGELCPGQTLLFILMMPPQSRMQPDINTWPSAKQTVPQQYLCWSQPIARSAMINPGILLHSPHTHIHTQAHTYSAEFCSKYKQTGLCRNVCFRRSNGDNDVTLEGISSPDDSLFSCL